MNTSNEDPRTSRRWPRRKAAAGRLSKEELQAQLRATRDDIGRQVQATRAHIDQANERIEARAGRNLVLAVGIGLALGALVLGSLIFIKEIFVVAAALIVVFTSLELATAFRKAGRRIDLVPVLGGSLAIVVAAYLGTPEVRWLTLLAVVALVSLWSLIGAVVARGGRDLATIGSDLVSSVLVIAYVPFLASFAIVLLAQEGGQWWVLAFLILVVSVDTGAYAAGLSFGKHPMAPRISPKKTWEGFAGAGVAAMIAGILLSVFMLDEPWWLGVIFGLVLLVTATMGDLGESLIKRDLGIKDMSSWLPGHGGFLDRLDSMLPSAPAALAIYIVSTLF